MNIDDELQKWPEYANIFLMQRKQDAEREKDAQQKGRRGGGGRLSARTRIKFQFQVCGTFSTSAGMGIEATRRRRK